MKQESKKAQKAREVAERKAAIEAAKLAERNRVFSTPLAIAIKPLKITAVAGAEIRANEWVNAAIERLEEAGWDINKLAPSPRSNIGREEYRIAQMRRGAYESITEFKADGYNDQSWRDMALPRIVKKDPKKMAQYIARAREMAAASYEAYVYKMVKKVGEHTDARIGLDNGGLWGYSHLYVTKPDGSVEKWRTQIITNCSVYGLLFNQWPSRIVKGE